MIRTLVIYLVITNYPGWWSGGEWSTGQEHDGMPTVYLLVNNRATVLAWTASFTASLFCCFYTLAPSFFLLFGSLPFLSHSYFSLPSSSSFSLPHFIVFFHLSPQRSTLTFLTLSHLSDSVITRPSPCCLLFFSCSPLQLLVSSFFYSFSSSQSLLGFGISLVSLSLVLWLAFSFFLFLFD